MPARKSLWTYFTGLDNGTAPKSRKLIVDALDYARTPPRIRDFREFDSNILQPAMNSLNAGTITAQQMLADVTPKIEALLK